MQQIVFHPIASQEFLDAIVWYEDRLTGLGIQFLNAVEKHLALIQQNPQHYAKRIASFREVKIQTFPYLIVYKVDPKSKTIYVSAIHHTSRKSSGRYRKMP